MSSIFKRMEEALKCVIENIKTKVSKAEKKKAFFQIMPYFFIAYLCNKVSYRIRASPGKNMFERLAFFLTGLEGMFANPFPSLFYRDVFLIRSMKSIC